MIYQSLKKSASKLMQSLKLAIQKLTDRPIKLKKDPVFVLGCGHSGTTLVVGLIGRHPAFYFVPFETYIFRPHRSFKEIKTFFSETSIEAGDKRIVEKTPRHVADMKRIFKIFPNAKIIAMVRDGRDVAVSMRKRGMELHKGMGRWTLACQQIDEFKNDERVIAIKYEELVADQVKTLDKVFEFLGEKEMAEEVLSSDEPIEWHFSKTKNIEEEAEKVAIKRQKHLDKRKEQINQPIYNDTRKWANELSDEEISMLNAKGEVVLKAWGYA